MSNRKFDELNQEDYEEGYEKMPSGAKVKVTRYKDGSSRVHWGGPCGSTSYNEFGEEC